MDVMEQPPAVAPAEDGQQSRSWTKELWFLGVVAVALALLLKSFLIQAFFIPSGSMETTLHGCPGCKGDRVLVNKVVFKFRDIHRGEIVVFNGKGTNFSPEVAAPPPANGVQRVLLSIKAAVGFGEAGDKDFIKRVIGVPGDTVACCTDHKVTVNGQPIDEPYVYLSDSTEQQRFDPVKVPPGELFLMGDHRDGSSDSRYNGTVPADKIVGRAFAVFWPAPRAKVLRVPETFTHSALGEPDPVRRNVPQGPPEVLGLVVPVVARRVRRSTD
jgi:signal peptidase I